MKLDPGAQQVIDLIKAAGRPPYETVGHVEARRLYLEARRVLQPDPAPVGEVRDLITQIVAHPTGHMQPMRLEIVGNLAILLAQPTNNTGAMMEVARVRN